MMARKHKMELWVAQLRLEEIHIFLDKDLHNVTLQEEVANLEIVVRRGENYIMLGVLRSIPLYSGSKRDMEAPNSIFTSSRGRSL